MVDEDMRGDHAKREREREFSKETREEKEERLQCKRIHEEQRRERERVRRLEVKDAARGKKSKITRDRDKDSSEKVALGMASTGAGRRGEVMYDQRLFNQEKGMDSVFATDDQYNIYDKGLFMAQSTLTYLIRGKKDLDSDIYRNANEQYDKLLKKDQIKADKTFTGISERAGLRDRLVEFEKEAEEADPFGFDQDWQLFRKEFKEEKMRSKEEREKSRADRKKNKKFRTTVWSFLQTIARCFSLPPENLPTYESSLEKTTSKETEQPTVVRRKGKAPIFESTSSYEEVAKSKEEESSDEDKEEADGDA